MSPRRLSPPSRPGRRAPGARFSLGLPALALLLGTLSLFAAAPAQAQTTVPDAPTGLNVRGGTHF